MWKCADQKDHPTVYIKNYGWEIQNRIPSLVSSAIALKISCTSEASCLSNKCSCNASAYHAPPFVNLMSINATHIQLSQKRTKWDKAMFNFQGQFLWKK